MFFVYIEWDAGDNTKTELLARHFFFPHWTEGKSCDEGHLGVVVVAPKITNEGKIICL